MRQSPSTFGNGITLTVGVLEENLTINTTRSDKSGIEGLDLVCCHDDLDMATVVETIQLVQQFQHSTLDFALTSRL